MDQLGQEPFSSSHPHPHPHPQGKNEPPLLSPAHSQKGTEVRAREVEEDEFFVCAKYPYVC
jgi:hypothetical protein